MSGQGWMGPTSAVLNYLSVIGADRDAEGNYLLVGEEGRGPASFMGAGDELVVPGSVCYLVDGRRIPLAANMPASTGIRPMVI